MYSSINMISLAILSLFFSACTSSTVPTPKPLPVQVQPTEIKNVPSRNDKIDITQKSPLFHAAVTDGCATAKGKYTKDSTLFNSDIDYKDGWFYGRRKCQPR
ncbi:MAG TPA: hypothetical protein EYG78_01140 [Sulfurovum sp.]|nr:hypothetical protein [Sulfurovum sp.]